MMYSYLAFILFSISGLIFADYTHKLVIFRDHERAAKTLLPVYLLLLFWDVLGIQLDIFFSGTSKYVTGWEIAPELPVEELFFLFLLCYLPLLVYEILSRRKNV